ncbi:hypothetical protein OHS70_06455 [Streptomyces sp. NBC_00390]|uniref:hypothetical protein n=1 Tax=Streptomyces sp. NBC_00390 TaxID=2975736 RepID=UPI002E1B28DB
MAKLVRQVRFGADVGYHGFCLQESDDAVLPVPYPDGSVFGRFLTLFPGRIDIFSAGHTHTAAVTAEVWDGRPPEEHLSHWDEHGEGEYVSTSGTVAVWSMSVGRTEYDIPLADEGGRWQVQVLCTGRAEAERLSAETGTADGVERYLVRFWPAD